MFRFRPLTLATEKIVGVFAALRNFFAKLGQAKEVRLKNDLRRFEEEKQRLGPDFKVSPATEQTLKEEERQVFGVKQLVEALPSDMPPAFYFDKLVETLQTLGRTSSSLDVGKIYVFKYIARSKGWYDVFPVSIIVDKHSYGVRGYNYHWERYMNYIQNPYREYRYDRFDSIFYEVKQHELQYVLQIKTFLPVFNR